MIVGVIFLMELWLFIWVVLVNKIFGVFFVIDMYLLLILWIVVINLCLELNGSLCILG